MKKRGQILNQLKKKIKKSPLAFLIEKKPLIFVDYLYYLLFFLYVLLFYVFKQHSAIFLYQNTKNVMEQINNISIHFNREY